MEKDEKQPGSETDLAIWRRSYYQLRALERRLVDVAREIDDPAELEQLYREVEALRNTTSELFTAAQMESVSRHVKLFRAGRRPVRDELALFTGRS
jgi:hypothetical protein